MEALNRTFPRGTVAFSPFQRITCIPLDARRCQAMTSSPLTAELAYADMQRLCSTHVRADLLPRQVLASIQRAVPFDTGCLVVLDPLTGWPVLLESNGSDVTLQASRFFRELLPADHHPGLGALATSRHRVTRITHRPDEYLIRTSRRYQATSERQPGAELRAVFSQRDLVWGGAILLRTRNAPAFDEQDEAFMEGIIPLVTEALQRTAMRRDAFAREPVPARETARHSPGILSIDRTGAVTLLSPSASYWLRQVSRESHASGTHLPDTVRLAASTLSQALENATPAHPTLHIQGKAGNWLTIEAFRAPSTDDIMVLIGPSSPDEIVELRERLYGLSTRERQIADLVLRGLSTRQISAWLSISESTVQGHLTHIFGKVEVDSRRALIQRLLVDQLFTASTRPTPAA
jgi:DNA-binding CsgD family transcriptional regulator